MNIFTKAPDPMLLGFFFDFSLSGNPHWEVNLDSEALYRTTVHVLLPESLRGSWIAGLNSIIRRLQCGRCVPIRLDYENAAQFFTFEQLQSLETANPTLNFYLYGAPAHLAEPVTSTKLDIEAICRAAKRSKYVEEQQQRTLDREAAAVKAT